MPKGRKGKPKRRKPAPQKLPPTPKKEDGKIFGLTIQWVLGVATVLGTLFGAVVFLPRPTVDANSSGDNASSVSFTIGNAGFIPLEEVTEAFAICNLEFGPLKFAGDCKEPKARVISPTWKKHRLEMDDKHTLDMREVFDTYASHAQVTAGDISIVVSYEPWFLPIKREKAFHFTTKTSNNGKLYWAPS